MTNAGMKTCPICGVKIVSGGFAGDRVLFSVGPPGTRATLWARVCQYTQKAGCINQDRGEIGEVKPDDYYRPEP